MDERIKAVTRVLGLLLMVAVMVALIKHIDKLVECKVEDPETGEKLNVTLYGDARSCQWLRKQIRPWEEMGDKLEDSGTRLEELNETERARLGGEGKKVYLVDDMPVFDRSQVRRVK